MCHTLLKHEHIRNLTMYIRILTRLAGWLQAGTIYFYIQFFFTQNLFKIYILPFLLHVASKIMVVSEQKHNQCHYPLMMDHGWFSQEMMNGRDKFTLILVTPPTLHREEGPGNVRGVSS